MHPSVPCFLSNYSFWRRWHCRIPALGHMSSNLPFSQSAFNLQFLCLCSFWCGKSQLAFHQSSAGSSAQTLPTLAFSCSTPERRLSPVADIPEGRCQGGLNLCLACPFQSRGQVGLLPLPSVVFPVQVYRSPWTRVQMLPLLWILLFHNLLKASRD